MTSEAKTEVSQMSYADRAKARTLKDINKSGLRPVGRAVLVEPYEPERKQSVIVLPPSISERSKMVETRVTVLEIGPECWKGEKAPRAAVGDKVLISKYCGVTVQGTLDSKVYRMVNDEDIYCQIDREA